jgi:Putative lumazine-binding
VIVLDAFRDIATVKVRSAPFVEYLHLARFDNRWLIVNALYVSLVEG